MGSLRSVACVVRWLGVGVGGGRGAGYSVGEWWLREGRAVLRLEQKA